MPSVSGVKPYLLSVPVLKEPETGENIFKLIHSELNNRGISFKNCIAFGTDSANVMVGKHKGVFAYLAKENPDLHLAACPCHLIHHAAFPSLALFH